MVRLSRETRQKQILENQINSMKEMFTADEFASKLSIKNSKIGMATIYRFLKEETRMHRLHSFQCGKKSIYSKSSKSHMHFLCEKCGKIEHVNLKKLDFLKDIKPAQVCHVQIDLYGTCLNCTKSKPL